MFAGVLSEIFDTIKNRLVVESVADLSVAELTGVSWVGFDYLPDGDNVGMIDAHQLLKSFGGKFKADDCFERCNGGMRVVEEGVIAEYEGEDCVIGAFGDFGLEFRR